MKTAKILLSIAILIIVVNAVASVRINGLGSYFEYLIPDTETDIELFPSHLGMIDSKYVQINHNGYSMNYDYFSSRNINFSLMPIASRLSYRVNLDIASNDRGSRIYLNDVYNRHSTEFDGREYGAALLTNTISYKLSDNFQLGCLFKYGVNWKEIDDERLEMEDSNIVIHDDMLDIEYNSDFLSTGINFKFMSKFKIDIALNYSYADVTDYSIRSSDFERIYSELDEFVRYIDEDSEMIECETEDMGISILLETSSDKIVNRYLLESHYILQSTEYLGQRNSKRLIYEDGELDYEYEDIFDNDKAEEMEIYSVKLGFGKTLSKEKWDISYGIKLYGLYSKTTRDESYYIFDFYQNIELDTTYTETAITNGENNFKINDWKAAIEVPFGVRYKFSDYICINSGLGMKLIRQEFEYFDNNEFSRWETDRYVVLGTSISPFECLKCDINFGYDFANFSNWQIDLKYFW